MVQQADLIRRIDKLPSQYLSEVYDFVGYLQQKAQKNNEMPADIEHKQETREWVNPLLGLGKIMGSTLTLERFREMQQKEVEQENENDQRLWDKI
jgi:hypothetical protein